MYFHNEQLISAQTYKRLHTYLMVCVYVRAHMCVHARVLTAKCNAKIIIYHLTNIQLKDAHFVITWHVLLLSVKLLFIFYKWPTFD